MQMGRGGKLKLKIKKNQKKKVPDLCMYQNLEAILLFFILNMVIVIKLQEKKKNDKSVDLCY